MLDHFKGAFEEASNKTLGSCSYNKDLISQGGGIFSRRAKSIDLSPEIQKMLGTRKQSLAPNDLIQMILKMDVDLLWNGGIGTYVKSEKE